MVSKLAPGPRMFVEAISVGNALCKTRSPVTPVVNTIVLPGTASALRIACRSEPGPESFRLVTSNTFEAAGIVWATGITGETTGKTRPVLGVSRSSSGSGQGRTG